MQISGLVKSSLIDYPGKVAAIIFTQGCNFRCGFCHNPLLLPIHHNQNTNFQFSEDKILEFLMSRVGKLDGVVITGGEPTLQADLIEFIKKIREMGFAIKLDTNGSNPNVLSNLLTGNLVNFIAMDIKNSPEEYQETCAVPFSEKIKESIEIIMNSGIDYEFRTTVLPAFHTEKSVEHLCQTIKGAKRYVIQNFRNGSVLDLSLKDAKSFNRTDLEKFKRIAERYVDQVQIRENI